MYAYTRVRALVCEYRLTQYPITDIIIQNVSIPLPISSLQIHHQ